MPASTLHSTSASATETRHISPLHLTAMGWALTTALVGLFILCLLSVLVWPTSALAHGWIRLFATEPDNLARTFAEGVLGSAVAAWITTVLFVPVYNRLIPH